MSQSGNFNKTDMITIRKIIDRVISGEIRIPAFQRDFVWSSNQVAFLLDSIYKNFPIGTVFLWKTNECLLTEKTLGNYTVPEPKKDHPIYYVLDGQQRITSLFSVFQTELKPDNNYEWIDIYFDFTKAGQKRAGSRSLKTMRRGSTDFSMPSGTGGSSS